MMKITLIILLFATFSNLAYSQCDCAAQATGMMQFQLPENEKKDVIGKFRLSALYKNIFGNEYYTQNKKAPAGMIEYYKVNFSSLNLTYYFNDKFTFFSDLAYFLSKEQKFRIGGSISGSGLSHISLGTKYSIFENQNLGNELLLVLGGRIPLANPDSLLPYHIQSSSGAFGFNANLNYYQSFFDRRFNLMLSIGYDHSLENKYNYQYGDNKSVDLMANYKINPELSLSLGNRLEFRSNDTKKSANVESGGSFSTASAGLHYRYSDFLLSGIYELPYYKNVNSNQMVTSYSFMFNLSWYFSL